MIFCLLLSFYGQCQNIYTSSFTQTWPTIFNTKIEENTRSIFFEANSITLISETITGKEVEIFYIQKIDEANGVIEFSCITKDKQRIRLVFTGHPGNVKFIDIFRFSLKTGEEEQMRLHLDNSGN